MLTHTMELDHDVDEVIDLLCSEAFCVGSAMEREDVVEASYRVLRDDADALHFELSETNYKRTKTGGIDRSATERGRTVYELDRGRRVITWRYQGEQDRVDIHGQSRYLATGEGRCRMVREVTIEVRIPVIGKGIAKLIEGEFKKGFSTLERQIRNAL